MKTLCVAFNDKTEYSLSEGTDWMRFLSRQSGPGLSLKTLSAGFLCLGLLSIIFSYFYFQKAVVLKTEGKVTQHRTRAQSVGDFLRASNIKLKKEDKVRPGLAAKIKSDLTIEIQKAKPIVIEINEEKIIFVTSAQTAGEALDELGIKLRAQDKIIPNKKTPLVKNSHVKVNMRSQKFEMVRSEVAFQTVQEKDPSLAAGTEQIVSPGKNGVVLKIFEVLSLPTGERKELSWERTLSQPENKIVKLGTKVEPRKPRTRLAAANTGSPARHRGSPAAPTNYNPNPPSRGGTGRTLAMNATAYAPGYGAGTITATGRRAGYGLVAVDPRVIPLGTRLYIEGYGNAIAADTGGAIKGNRIDLGYNSGSEAFAFGRRPVSVQVLP